MNEKITANMPILALRGMTVFPEQTVHFDVGRVKSALALEYAMKHDQHLLLLPQKNILDDDPRLKDLFPIGTVVKVKQILKTQGDNVRVLVSGLYRARVLELLQFEPFMSGHIDVMEEVSYSETLKTKALRREAVSLYGAYSDMLDHPVQGVQLRIIASEDCGYVADSIAQHSGMEYTEKAKLLCQLNPVKRLESALLLLQQELQMLQLESDIQEKTHAVMDQNQRDYFLREQMKVIREELGDADDEGEFFEYERRIRA